MLRKKYRNFYNNWLFLLILTQHDIKKHHKDGSCDINIIDWAGQHCAPQESQSVVVNWNFGFTGLHHEVLWQQTERGHCRQSGQEEDRGEEVVSDHRPVVMLVRLRSGLDYGPGSHGINDLIVGREKPRVADK